MNFPFAEMKREIREGRLPQEKQATGIEERKCRDGRSEYTIIEKGKWENNRI